MDSEFRFLKKKIKYDHVAKRRRRIVRIQSTETYSILRREFRPLRFSFVEKDDFCKGWLEKCQEDEQGQFPHFLLVVAEI